MRRIAYTLAAVCLTVAGGAVAAREGRVSGPVAVEVLRVIDGDSFAVIAHMWPGQYVDTLVRVAGVDTPEMRGRCPAERGRALQAKEFTEKFLSAGAPLVIRNVSLDKYGGRVVADVIGADGDNLAAALVRADLAYPYDGGTKRGWCP